MALLFMDSFDHYATADLTKKWTQLIDNSFPVAPVIGATGRHSSNGIRWPGGTYAGRVLTKTLSTTGATVIVGFSFANSTPFSNLTVNSNFNPSGYQDSNFVLAIRQGGTGQVWVRLNNTGTLTVLRGSTELGTTSSALPLGTGHSYIELKVLIDPAVGTVDLRVNGEEWLTRTAQNTRNTGSSTWNELLIGGARGIGGSAVVWDYDDLYLLDGSGSAPWTTFLGDCRVDAKVSISASANGAPNTGWTPTGGLNFQNVDDIPPNNDTDYNTAGSVGLIDTFIVQDMSVVGATIYGIQHNVFVKKTDAGVCSVAPVIRHSGTDYPGSAISPGVAYAYISQIATEIAPGVALTETNFNAAEFGYKRTA